jgi:hypothetical protein
MLIVCLVVVFWGNVSIAQDNEHHSGQKTEMFIGVDSPAGKVVMKFHLALRTSDKITARKLLSRA